MVLPSPGADPKLGGWGARKRDLSQKGRLRLWIWFGSSVASILLAALAWLMYGVLNWKFDEFWVRPPELAMTAAVVVAVAGYGYIAQVAERKRDFSAMLPLLSIWVAAVIVNTIAFTFMRIIPENRAPTTVRYVAAGALFALSLFLSWRLTATMMADEFGTSKKEEAAAEHLDEIGRGEEPVPSPLAATVAELQKEPNRLAATIAEEVNP